MSHSLKKVLVILGPTATGKTDLALALAKKFNGELISCDSRQVYRGLDIGTGKVPGEKVSIRKENGYWSIGGVKIWMLDVIDAKKRYTVFDYEKSVKKILDNVLDEKKLPIIVGGTGLYLKALLKGFDSLRIPTDNKLRVRLENLTVEELQDELKSKSSEKFESLNNSDKNNPRRLVRAIELVSTASKSNESTGPILKDFDILKIGLTARGEIIGKRIRDRILKRLEIGMIEEVEELHKKGLTIKRMKELGLEYSIIADFIEKKIKTRDELIKTLRLKISQYAKRQITWFKKEENVEWFDITEKEMAKKVEKRVSGWYNS